MDMVCTGPDIREPTSQDLDSFPRHTSTENVNFKPSSSADGGSDAGTKTSANDDLNQIIG